MKLENQVVNLELSKKLKELGVKQESLFYWSSVEGKKASIVYTKGKNISCDYISAFTSSELGEMLPVYISTMRQDNGWSAVWTPDRYKKLDGYHSAHKDTEANCRAFILITLIEKKIVNVEDLNK